MKGLVYYAERIDELQRGSAVCNPEASSLGGSEEIPATSTNTLPRGRRRIVASIQSPAVTEEMKAKAEVVKKPVTKRKRLVPAVPEDEQTMVAVRRIKKGRKSVS